MDEKTLVANVQAGDRGAFELLVSLHYRAVYNLAFQFMKDHGFADEVVQQSFLKAYNAIGGFRQESSFKSWLFRIVSNTAKNQLRSKEREHAVPIEDVEAKLGVLHRGYQTIEHQQTAQILRQAVARLPQKQRQALELRIFEDLSFQEIAMIMECPFDTAKANYRHALLNLRKVWNSGSEGLEMKLAFADFVEDESDEP